LRRTDLPASGAAVPDEDAELAAGPAGVLTRSTLAEEGCEYLMVGREDGLRSGRLEGADVVLARAGSDFSGGGSAGFLNSPSSFGPVGRRGCMEGLLDLITGIRLGGGIDVDVTDSALLFPVVDGAGLTSSATGPVGMV
jgi:hypothetical protein